MNFDNDLLTAVLFVVVAIAAIRLVPRYFSGAQRIRAPQFRDKLSSGEQMVVLDVRSPDEFKSGHVAGAVNLPVGDLPARLSEMAEQMADYKDQPIYAVCRTANRSAMAARQLKRAGFTNVWIVDGGMTAWQRAGFPVETGA